MRKTTVFMLGLVLALCSVSSAALVANMRIGSNVTSAPPNNNPLDPTVLSDLAPYACLRFMDWEGTVVGGWGPYTTNEQNIELCNKLGVDGWFCVFHTASDADVRSMAQSLKSKMDPSLKIYLEYSNETWNTAGFWLPGVLFCENLAKNAGVVPAGMTDQVMIAGVGHVLRATQIWAIFKEVFGDEMSTRVVKVIAGHAGNTGLTITHINALLDPQVNPHGFKMDAYAIAPYFGQDHDGGNMTEAMALAKGIRIGTHLKYINERYNAVVGANARLIGYEGGQHFATNQSTFSDNPGAYDVYMAYLDMLAPFLDLFCHYTHTHPMWGAQAFGAKHNWGQPIAQAHKYRALVDWANAHPYVDPVAVSRKPAPHKPAPRNVSFGSTIGNAFSRDKFDMTGRRINDNGLLSARIMVTPTGVSITKGCVVNNTIGN